MTTDPGVRDEEIPLLHSERARKQPSFPWFQFSILFAVQTAEYLALNTTYPFIPDLIRSIGIIKEEKDVGYYVGLLTSTFYAAEMTTTLFFARLSDHVGRKLVFLACVMGVSISINGFGLSTTFWALIPCQALMGGFTGTRGVTRSMLAEMIDLADMARAIAYFDMSYYLAGAIGSKIGGSLSRPAEQFPRLFGSIEFFKKYPYYLPCGICSILCTSFCLFGTILLKETVTEPLVLSSLFKKKSQKDSEHVIEEQNECTRKSQSLRAILVPSVIIAATNLAAMSMVERFFWGAEALYLSTPIRDGGLGLSPRAIGTFTSLTSIIIGASQLFVFPCLHDKWGSRFVCILGVAASIPRFIMWPVMNWMARRDGHSSLVWLALGSQACCSVLAQLSCLGMWVLIIQVHGSSASVAGVCQTAASVLRAIAPAVANSLFSLSIDKGYLGGNLAYFVFVCSAILALCATSLLPSDRKIRNKQRIDQ